MIDIKLTPQQQREFKKFFGLAGPRWRQLRREKIKRAGRWIKKLMEQIDGEIQRLKQREIEFWKKRKRQAINFKKGEGAEE